MRGARAPRWHGTRTILVATLVLAAGCVSHPGAYRVKVTRNPADVAGCVALGPVAGQAPYEGPKDAINQMRDQVIGLGGNVLLVLSEFVTKTGAAYRCAGG